MSNIDDSGATVRSDEMERVISCDLSFIVTEPAEIIVQVVAAESAGHVLEQRFEVATDGSSLESIVEIRTPRGEKMHVIRSDPGRLSVSYRSKIRASPARLIFPAPAASDPGDEDQASMLERQIYLRPSRYCPSDHLLGFAVAEFGMGPEVGARVEAITDWIRLRVGYLPGSSDVHDSAEDTLLTGVGTCRDFAHLGIALCRATGIPARFAAVYAPGLSPMDFHAVFEAYQDGYWCVHDSTRLAPRSSLVRIATGRDASDAAFSAINGGIVSPEGVSVSATVGSLLPADDHSELMELA